MNELPTAVVTVWFDKPVTGSQLAALTQQVVGQNERGVGFVVEHRYYDGDVIGFGQTSDYPHNHIRVVPSLDGPSFFSPSDIYSEVKVTSHSWGDSVYADMVDRSRQSVIDAVKKFAADLTGAYETTPADGFPEYTEPKNSGDDW